MNSVLSNVTKNAPANVTSNISANVMRTVMINSNNKKVRYEIDDHITICDHYILLSLCRTQVKTKKYGNNSNVKMENINSKKVFNSIVMLKFGKTKVASKECYVAKEKQ